MEIKIPDIGIDQAEVIEILVNVNDLIKKEQIIIVIEGEKTSMEIPSPYSGIVKNINVKVSDIVKHNSIIMTLDTDQSIKSDIKVNNTQNNEKCLERLEKKKLIHASPIIRRLSRLKNIDIQKITGSGRNNRITKCDFDYYIDHIFNKTQDCKNTFKKSDTDDINNYYDRFGSIKKIKLTKSKKKIGDKLLNNCLKIPHVTQFDEADITDLEKFRINYNKKINVIQDNRLTILSFVIKVVAKGLEKFPYFNSSISSDNSTVFLKQYINIGFAVDTEEGLLVPVIKDVKNKNLFDIAKEVFMLSKKSRSSNLTISDVQGGCFTISSLGNIGGKFFSPIINHPEVAILGISKSFYKPIWNKNCFVPRLMLPLSLSYNHRIINGADGARFITFINQMLSDIRLLLI